MLAFLLVYYFTMLGILIFASYPTKLEPHRLLFKILTSMGFIVIAAYCAIGTGNLAFFWWMLPALVACFVGDIFMALTDKNWNDTVFTIGVAAFAVAHLAFLVAISQLYPFNALELILPALVAVGALFIDRIPRLNVGKLKTALVPYGFLVTWLFSKTLVWVLAGGANALSCTMMTGALLFLISDALLLFIYFFDTPSKSLRFFNQITYYGGMALLALAIVLV